MWETLFRKSVGTLPCEQPVPNFSHAFHDEIDVWFDNTFENNFGIEHECTKYLKGSCSLGFDVHFSIKPF